MKPLLSDCAAPRLVQRAGAIELVIWRLCCDVAQTVRLRPPNLRRSGDRHKSTRSRGCKRRSNNPSLRRPDFPVAPEQKSGSRYPFALGRQFATRFRSRG